MDEEAIKLGLLLETAQTHQQLTEATLEKLRLHTQGLDAVVREEIRRTLVAELHALHVEIRRTLQALQQMRNIANARVTLWGIAIPAISALVAALVVWLTLPLIARGQ